MTIAAQSRWDQSPLVLLVPGLNNSGPDHWQSHWERDRSDCERVDLGMWENPHRNTWVNKLNLAIRAAGRPVVLVAHSLGCHAVAWWAQFERPAADGPVVAAILVAPPEVDGAGIDARLAGFGPAVAHRLPFTTILAASRSDHTMPFDRARALAEGWGSRFIDLGALGHVNAESGIGAWAYGQFLLDRVIYSATPPCPLEPAVRPDARAAVAERTRVPAFAPVGLPAPALVPLSAPATHAGIGCATL